jgi:hypothetical protein
MDNVLKTQVLLQKMFKKFNEKENVSGVTQLKSSGTVVLHF